MNYDVSNYQLPKGASAADRMTLQVWKSWVTWVRPVLFTTAWMVVASVVVGTFIAKTGGFVAVWSSADYAAAVAIGTDSLTEMSGSAWTRGIGAQLASVLVAVAGAWVILRKSSHPAAVGAISGFLVVTMHLSLSSQWSLEPIAGAPAGYQVAALVTLWLLPAAAALIGLLIVRRQRASNQGSVEGE